jgi:protocatechuate 3,4-dioxygenase beta subunit
VTADLLNASGSTIATTTTDPNGAYVFPGLSANTSYTLAFTAPPNSELEESNGATWTDVVIPTGSNTVVNAVAYQPATFSGIVFVDTNQNGVQDNGEVGLAGVGVALRDASGNTVATATTGSDGSYSVSLAPGTYTAVFTAPSTSGYVLTGASQTWSETVTLGSGQISTGNNVSAYSQTATSAISGTVFVDNDGLGHPDSNNPGLAGVTVTLLSGSTTVASTTTDSNGNYSFSVSPGTYTVQITQPTGFSLEGSTTTTWSASVDAPSQNTVVNEGVYQAITLGGTVFVDTNQNGVQDNGESGLSGVGVTLFDLNANVVATATSASDGSFSLSGVQPGIYTVRYAAPSGYVLDGSSDTLSGTVMVGSGQTLSLNVPAYSATATSTISGTVFVDSNGNGVQDPGESGLAGVTVALLDANGNPITDVGGQAITTTTNSSGQYSFLNLSPGAYELLFTTPSGSTYVVEASGSSTWTGPVHTPGPTSVLNVGVVQPATVSGRVWLDANANGIEDPGEQGLPGVTVELQNSATLAAVATTVTGADGSYNFTGIAPGTYTVVILTGVAGTLQNQGANNTINSHFDPTTHSVTGLTLAAGQTVTHLDGGLLPEGTGSGSGPGTGSIGDFVWYDTNGNGIQDPGEQGAGGVLVELFDSSNDLVAVTTSAANGFYDFTGLAAGSYHLLFIPPNGSQLTQANQGTDPNKNSSPDPTTGYTGSVYLFAGQTITDIDAGLVASSSGSGSGSGSGPGSGFGGRSP